jgi:hypothetical protein
MQVPFVVSSPPPFAVVHKPGGRIIVFDTPEECAAEIAALSWVSKLAHDPTI